MTDPHLVARAQQGDLTAFEELVKRYQREIYGLACRLVMDPEEAKDVTQQALLQAFIHIRGFKQQSQFRTWLFRIAINQCYNFLKTRKKYGDPMDTRDMKLVGEDSPEADLAAKQDRERLYQALEKLPPKQRAVITLKLEQGFSYEEISQVLGGTAGAARVNYCQALKTLKKHLKGEDEDEVAVRSNAKVAARLPRR
ncbi:MAG: sigma-70 family RNA polymerase sigma factor [Deltaproteobacteria bacterium]|nr:sigma-70 family RNA polymerase sigma factor [Deltaproteobacteria bacterium]